MTLSPPGADPFVVHAPTSWKKLRQLVDHGERKGGREFVARYRPLCGCASKVEIPPNVEIRRDEDGYYFVCGPHPRYYRRCPACAEASEGGA